MLRKLTEPSRDTNYDFILGSYLVGTGICVFLYVLQIVLPFTFERMYEGEHAGDFLLVAEEFEVSFLPTVGLQLSENAASTDPLCALASVCQCIAHLGHVCHSFKEAGATAL